MSRILVIGCGGVASVAIRKCCQNEKVFKELCIASRTKEKCDALKEKLEGKTSVKITTAQVDADHASEVAALIRSYQPDVVLNLALPYQDLSIMEACLIIGCTTFVLSVIGVVVGNFFGTRYKRKAEIAGGVIRILIGLKILLEHLGIIAF